MPTPPPAERILVIRLGAVGDVVRTLPAVSALRAGYPRARITWLVEPPSRSVVEGQPWVDEVMVLPRPRLSEHLRRGRWIALARELGAFRSALRRRRFQLVVDFHSILKSGLLSALSGAPRRVAYARPYGREGGWLFANHRARLPAPPRSRFERNLALVRYLGVGAMPAERPLAPSDAARARLEAALPAGPAPVALHPGTSPGTPHKRWSASGYGAVARALRADTGAIALVTAGPDAEERALAQQVVEAAAGAARLAPTTDSLDELAALLERCRLYVGSDTGPTHVASLVGTPVVQILGPTHPVENAPWTGTPARTVREPVACSPCRRGCDAAPCMRRIRSERVIEAARELLATAAERGA